MVINTGKMIDRPQVKITQLYTGTRLAKENQYMVDLGEVANSGLQVRRLLLNYLEAEP